MALKGSSSKNLDRRGQVKLISEWTATQNKTANTSTITVKNYLYFLGAIYAGATQNGSTTIGGQKGSYTYVIGSHPSGITKLIGTVTKTVAHKSDGTLTTTVSTDNTVRVTYAGEYIGNAAMSYNIILDRIPRSSTLSALSNANIPSGSPTFTIAAADASFTHAVNLQINGKTIASRTGLKGGAHNFNLTTAEKNAILSAMSTTASTKYTMVLGTYLDDTFIGVLQSLIATLTVDGNIMPVINNISYTIEDYEYYNASIGMNVPVYDLSALRITTSAVGGQGASIASVVVDYNGRVYRDLIFKSETLSPAFQGDTITSTVTDTRGRKVTMTHNVEFPLKLDRPVVEGQSSPSQTIPPNFYRSDEWGNPSDDGTYLYGVGTIKMNSAITQDNSYKIEVRPKNESTWHLLMSGFEQMRNFTGVFWDYDLDGNSSYEVRITLKNTLYDSEYTYNVATAFTTVDYRVDGKGIAFGKVSEKQAFEIDFPTEVLDTLSVFTKTNNPIDNKLIRFHRSDGSQLAAIMFDTITQDLNLHMYDVDGVLKSNFIFGDNGIFTDGKCYIQVAVGTSNTNNTSMSVPAAWNSTSSIPWRTTLFARNNAFTAQNGTTYVANRDIDVRITLQTTSFNHNVQTDISKNITINGTAKTISYSRVLGSYAHDTVSMLVSLKAGDEISCAFTAAAALTFTLFWSTTLTIEEI